MGYSQSILRRCRQTSFAGDMLVGSLLRHMDFLQPQLAGYSNRGTGFSLWWLLLLQSRGSRAPGLQYLPHTGLTAPWHVGSGIEPMSLALAGRFFTTGTTREVQSVYLAPDRTFQSRVYWPLWQWASQPSHLLSWLP